MFNSRIVYQFLLSVCVVKFSAVISPLMIVPANSVLNVLFPFCIFVVISSSVSVSPSLYTSLALVSVLRVHGH